MIKTKSVIERFLKILKEGADEKYRWRNVRTMKSDLEMIGTRVPQMRKIARDWLGTHKDISEDEFLSLLEKLWSRPVFETRSLALELLTARKKTLKKFDWAIAERWLKDADNWAHCDTLSCNIFGFLVLWDHSHLARLRAWTEDSNKWLQRAGIVSTLQLIRKKEIAPEEVLAMIDQVIGNKDPMVQKAISWVLWELVRAGPATARQRPGNSRAGHRSDVEEYLKKNRSRLAGYVVREVENKLRTGLKSGKTRKRWIPASNSASWRNKTEKILKFLVLIFIWIC